MEISPNYNRSILSINNNMIQHCQFFNESIDFQTNLQPTILKVLANTPYRSQTPEYFISTEMVATELKKLI